MWYCTEDYVHPDHDDVIVNSLTNSPDSHIHSKTFVAHVTMAMCVPPLSCNYRCSHVHTAATQTATDKVPSRAEFDEESRPDSRQCIQRGVVWLSGTWDECTHTHIPLCHTHHMHTNTHDLSAQTMCQTRPDMMEYQLESVFEHHCKMKGAQTLSFPPVVAGGSRANCLHYIANNRELR